MPLPKSTQAYQDCERHFQSALESDNGIALTLETPGQATRLIQRMNTYRAILRKQSKEVYEPDHAQWGTSPFDAFSLKQDPANLARVLIQNYSQRVLKIETLEPPDEPA